MALARDRVRKLDPNLPLYGVRTMEQRVTDSLLVERLIAGLSGSSASWPPFSPASGSTA